MVDLLSGSTLDALWFLVAALLLRKKRKTEKCDLVELDSLTFPVMFFICHLSRDQAHLLPSASSVESGSSFLLVSGRRKPRAPLTRVRPLKTTVGMDQWYMANMLSGGDSKPPALLAMEPKPEAVCLKHERTHVKVFLCGFKNLNAIIFYSQ